MLIQTIPWTNSVSEIPVNSRLRSKATVTGWGKRSHANIDGSCTKPISLGCTGSHYPWGYFCHSLCAAERRPGGVAVVMFSIVSRSGYLMDLYHGSFLKIRDLVQFFHNQVTSKVSETSNFTICSSIVSLSERFAYASGFKLASFSPFLVAFNVRGEKIPSDRPWKYLLRIKLEWKVVDVSFYQFLQIW